MIKIKEKDYGNHYIEYNGEEYHLGDKVMYANGGLYENGKIVSHAEEAEIVALDAWDEYDESDYQFKYVVMLNRVAEDGTYLNDIGDDDGVIYKKGAKKYNEWALFSEIEKIKGDEINDNLLEERVTRTNTFIKGTNIAVFENLDSLDEEKIECVKETIRFLLENDKLSINSQYVSVRSQDETWSIVDIVDEIMDEDTDFRDITTYDIIKEGKKNLIDNVNQWIGEDGKYKTKGEVFNCIEFKGNIYKIKKSLYLMRI